MNVRLATVADANSIWDVHVSAIRELCVSDYSLPQIVAWSGPKRPEDYHRPIFEQRLLVAEAEDRIAGFGEFGTKEIHALYVHPHFTRKGVGTLLFQRLIAELESRGVAHITLEASLTSVPFYRAMGCTAGAPFNHCLRSGVEIPCVRMTFDMAPKNSGPAATST